MSHWEPFAGGYIHVLTVSEPPTVRMTRRDKKHYARMEKLLASRVQLGPALVGMLKMEKTLKRGKAHAGRI